MTTNVVDMAAGLVATDSRWSWPVNRKTSGIVHARIYVDDAGFDKIEVGADYSFVFAGKADLMEKWKAWRRDPNRVLQNPPPVADGFALCIIDMATGEPEFEHGQKISGSDHRFAGTGARFAYRCWDKNRDAVRAVTSAYAEDALSGGVVKFLNLKSKEHNVDSANDSKAPNKEVMKKGLVMYSNLKPELISAEDAAKADPIVREALARVASGSVSAEAPDGNDPTVWTDLDKERLQKALNKCFGPKNK